jgi:hypothetical protein
VIRLSQWFITLCLWVYCISFRNLSKCSKQTDYSDEQKYSVIPLETLLVDKKSTFIKHGIWNSLETNYQASHKQPWQKIWGTSINHVTNLQRHNVINHCDRRITLLSDTDISFGLFNLIVFTYFDMSFGW